MCSNMNRVIFFLNCFFKETFWCEFFIENFDDYSVSMAYTPPSLRVAYQSACSLQHVQNIQPQPVANELDGTLSLDHVKDLIKPDDFHYARTRLLCLENTWHGRPLPLNYLDDARDLSREH